MIVLLGIGGVAIVLLGLGIHGARNKQPLETESEDLTGRRSALVDAGSACLTLWVSYVFLAFYSFVAVGAVTHEGLLYESPVKLPFFSSIELPLKGFFFFGPLLFLILYFYLLIHCSMLVDKAIDFNQARQNAKDAQEGAEIRRQLPANYLIQILAWPLDHGRVLRLCLWSVGWISLVAGPVLLLLFFQFQFLPYHHEAITWWHRIFVTAALVLALAAWIRWFRNHVPKTTRRPQDTCITRPWFTWLGMVPFTASILLLTFVVATFPSSPLEASNRRHLPSWIVSLRDLMVGGVPDPITGRPTSLFADRLILPGIDVLKHTDLDTEQKIAAAKSSISLKGRHLEYAVLKGSRLRKADLRGAFLHGANLDEANLREARMDCEVTESDVQNQQKSTEIPTQCTDFTDASLNWAILSDAHMENARLQGVSLRHATALGGLFFGAQMQNALLDDADLAGSALLGAALDGASLTWATLQGANLSGASFIGASLDYASLQAAQLDKT
jgi:uncharacterized protein YjbI with pentapeptide repeats